MHGHHPPKGEEKEILKRFETIIAKLDKISDKMDLFPTAHSASIHVGHAMEGVRINGHQDTITALTSYRDIKEYADAFQVELKEAIRSGKRVQELRDKAKKLMEIFIVCPVCHGKKGHSGSHGTIGGKWWEDCGHCNGRGIIRKIKE